MSNIALAPAVVPGAVTAVLVCWNHVRFAREAILSVLHQIRRPHQVIVFDNGSIDGSGELLQQLAQEYDFTLILQDNIGLVRTLNRGLAMSTGEFFSLMATDDAWVPEKTQLQATYLEAHPELHMIGAQVRVVDENSRAIAYANVMRPGKVTFADLMTRGNVVYGPTMMCRTETLRRVGGYDETLRIEDYSLALRFASVGLGIYVLPDVVSLYRRHGANWTNQSLADELLAIGHRYRSCAEYPGYVAFHFPRRFRLLVEGGERLRALQWLRYEPVEWMWSDVGVGMVKFFAPLSLLRWAKGVVRIAYLYFANRSLR